MKGMGGFKNKKRLGDKEMAQQIRAWVAPPEEPSSFPSTHISGVTTTCNFSPRPEPLWASPSYAYT